MVGQIVPTRASDDSAASDRQGLLKEANVHVVVVHSIKSPRSRSAMEWDKWRKETSKHRSFEAASALISQHKFYNKKFLADGKPPFEDEAKNLGWFLEKLQAPQPGPIRGSSEATEPSRAPHDSRLPAFILIGHSLGCWVIKCLIRDSNNRAIVQRTRSIILVDDVPDVPPATEPSTLYRQHLATVLETPKQIPPDHLVETTREIDSQFLELDCTVKSRITRLSWERLSGAERYQTKTSSWDRTRLREGVGEIYNKFRKPGRTGPDGFTQKVIEAFTARQPGPCHEAVPAQSSRLPPAPAEAHSLPGQPGAINGDQAGSPSHPPASGALAENGASPPSSDQAGPSSPRGMSTAPTGPSHTSALSFCLKEARDYWNLGQMRAVEYFVNHAEGHLDHVGQRNGLGVVKCEIRYLRTLIRMNSGDYRSAKRDLEETRRDTKDEEQAYEVAHWLAHIYVNTGEYLQAVRVIQELLGQEQQRKAETSTKPSVSLRGNLALAYAHLGQFEQSRLAMDYEGQQVTPMVTAERAHNTPDTLGQRNTTDLEIRHSLMLQARARVAIVCGDYANGLENAEQALEGMEMHFGIVHPRTLEMACTKALCMALASATAEATIDAGKLAWKTLEYVRSEMSDDHPLALEALHVLAILSRAQGCFWQSAHTGAQVFCTMIQVLGSAHPATLAAGAELAVSHRRDGEYETAAKTLVQVIGKSMREYTALNQETLHYCSELATTYYRCGNLDLAEDLVLAVLKVQWLVYTQSAAMKTREESHGEEEPATKAEHLIQPILDFLLESCTAEPKAPSYFGSWTLHPYMMETLQTAGVILSQKPEPEIRLGKTTLEAVLKEKSRVLGDSHISTLACVYELGVLRRELQDGRAAAESFEVVYDGRKRSLGDSHPDTLLANRELLITNLYGDFSVPPDMTAPPQQSPETPDMHMHQWYADIERHFEHILLSHEYYLGEAHPQTISSKLLLLVTQAEVCAAGAAAGSLSSPGEKERDTNFEKNKQKVAATRDGILNRLRAESVREERFVEAARMEESIASVLEELGEANAARQIRDHLSKEASARAAVADREHLARAREFIEDLTRATVGDLQSRPLPTSPKGRFHRL